MYATTSVLNTKVTFKKQVNIYHLFFYSATTKIIQFPITKHLQQELSFSPWENIPNRF